MKKFTFCAALVVGVAALCILPSTQSAHRSDKLRLSPNGIPGRYIVVLEPAAVETGAADPLALSAEATERRGAKVDRVFTSALYGFSGELSEDEAEKISQDPRVAYVEQDIAIEAQTTQAGATWGISRIDQHPFASPIDTNYNYQATGAGVSVYVVDTGVLVTHPDFGGRAVAAFDSYNENIDISQCNGHGTHVAGTIGSNTYGVAKNVNIYSVKVFPCYGGTSSASVIAGIDWINRNAPRPAVVNMSLAGGISSTLDQAVKNSIGRGIVYVVAAGNFSDDACNYSPADVSEAITVGSTGRSDSRDETTNFGRCIDLFAPGVAIESTWNQYPLPYPTFTMSGTSTASPHVAGIAALYLEANPAASPADVSRALKSNATPDVVYNAGTGSPNLLAYSMFAAPPAAGCTAFNGSLAATGSAEFQSSSAGFAGRTGAYSASLNVPAGSRFQLGLQVKKGGRWANAAVSSGTSSVETVSYRGKSGTYRWSILSLNGGGAYSLCSVVP
jgi:subtilisin family serine protease